MYRKLRQPGSKFASEQNIIEMKTIKTPEGVALLMENMWLRHKAGMKQRTDNLFFVDFPPLTEEEKIHRQEEATRRPDDTQEELFGGWI